MAVAIADMGSGRVDPERLRDVSAVHFNRLKYS